MANPIIKIKSGSTRPANFNPATGVGLTAAELGVNLTAGEYGFYIGGTAGVAVTFGAEIDVDTTLSSNSNFKVPTQKAVKTYASSLATGQQTVIHSRYKQAVQSISANAQAVISWGGTVDFEFYPPGQAFSNYFTVDIASGVFNHNFSETSRYLIIYQVTWDPFTTTQNYNSSAVNRSAWIQKYTTLGTSDPAATQQQNVYGFTTLLCPPLQISILGGVSGTQVGSAIITLAQNEKFSIVCRNHGTAATNVAITSLGNFSGTQETNFINATRLQILKV